MIPQPPPPPLYTPKANLLSKLSRRSESNQTHPAADRDRDQPLWSIYDVRIAGVTQTEETKL